MKLNTPIETRFEDWGLLTYPEALSLQKQYFNRNLKAQIESLPADNCWVFCEHPPVLTMGKHGNSSNLLYDMEKLKQMQVGFYEVERGGDVTFHGPGQLVAYPIWNLLQYNLGLRSYIRFLEEVIIRTLAEYGLKGERIEGASGVWLGKGTPNERKICAIGVKSSRFITMHGLALNINTDLSYFSLINPCGFLNKGVTSMSKETGLVFCMEDVKVRIRKHVIALLNCDNFL
ncbi:MAG: lipoyl(octanoyl) transferase LipB [Bacteroidales bacterium]